MTIVTKKLVLKYSPAQMQELVADISSYPSFIPWIRSLRVRSEKQSERIWQARATASVGFKGFSESFTTDVSSNTSTECVEVKLVKGPFKHLQNQWNFKENKEGCEISFKIDFEFSNFILQALMKANVDRAIDKLITVFIDEADRRYGNASS